MMKVWAFIDNEGRLCCALIPEAVPQGVEPTVFDVDSPDDLILDGGIIRMKTEEEKVEDLKKVALLELKSVVYSLLAPSDYVIIKIAEATVIGEDVSTLKDYYKDVLGKRERVREWNERMKRWIKEAKTVEEMNRIFEEIRKMEVM